MSQVGHTFTFTKYRRRMLLNILFSLSSWTPIYIDGGYRLKKGGGRGGVESDSDFITRHSEITVSSPDWAVTKIAKGCKSCYTWIQTEGEQWLHICWSHCDGKHAVGRKCTTPSHSSLACKTVFVNQFTLENNGFAANTLYLHEKMFSYEVKDFRILSYANFYCSSNK